MARILLIDDDALFCELLLSVMSLSGHESVTACSLEQGRKALSQSVFDVVFLDVGLPDGNGLSLIPEVRKRAEAPEVVIITGEGDPDGAELAMLNGALDYIQKPASIATITDAVERSLAFRHSRQEDAPLADRQGIVGSSMIMEACIRNMSEAASSDVSVLITGETGTGKELFARAIHRNSTRKDGPFVIVDCATISEALIESELFGHERGAFTGADRARDGLIKQAHGGTLFLDEVGELPMAQQKAFLRVLQEHCFRPVGAKGEQHSDFRVVAATNRNLWEMAERNGFRKDLLFRLQAVRLDLPPLRKRTDDIAELVAYFLSKRCRTEGYSLKECTKEYLEELTTYPWPGNVRELLNAVDHSFLTGRNSSVLMAEHLPSNIRAAVARYRLTDEDEELGAAFSGLVGMEALGVVGESVHYSSPSTGVVDEDAMYSVAASFHGFSSDKVGQGQPLPTWKACREQAVAAAEREYLTTLIASTQGNIVRASEIAGISRQRLYVMLRKHGIVRGWSV